MSFRLIPFVLLLTACADTAPEPATQGASSPIAFGSAGADAGVVAPMAMVAVPAMERAAPAMRVQAQSDRKLVRTGRADIEVEEVDTAVRALRELAASLGGMVANEITQTGDERRRTATIELRLPANRFDTAVAGLAELGTMASVSVNTADVTDEYVDLEVRIANGRRLEQRLLALIDARTGDLAQVLQAERELARVRTEVESYEGRLRVLAARIAMSTLTVHAYEPAPIVAEHPGESVLDEAFRQAWRNFVRTVASAIMAAGTALPLILLVSLPAGGFLVFRRRRRR